ncbi:membrane lipoprotein lipid attachment site-containing protein [Streptococcaceae bacterium ESL0687]|nr:membrane lipoprotein lipid attachment site-containing protein [Streptococcaceae bacterium ESL0687]
MKKYLFILSSVAVLTACGNHKTSEVKSTSGVKTEEVDKKAANKSDKRETQIDQVENVGSDTSKEGGYQGAQENSINQEPVSTVSTGNNEIIATSNNNTNESIDYNAGLTSEDIARNEEYNGTSMTDEEIDAIDAQMPPREDGLPRRSRGKASFPVDASTLNEEVAMRIIREGLKEYDEKYGLILGIGLKNKNGITVTVTLKNYPGEYGGSFPCFVKNDGSWQIVG